MRKLAPQTIPYAEICPLGLHEYLTELSELLHAKRTTFRCDIDRYLFAGWKYFWQGQRYIVFNIPVIGDLRRMIPLFHPPKQATCEVEVGAETGEAD